MSRELTLWGAKGPDGLVVRSSIGTFRSVAQRYALRKKNYEVVRLGSINIPHVDFTATAVSAPVPESAPAPVPAPAPDIKAQEAPVKRGRGRPRKIKPETVPIKRGPGRPRKVA